MPSSAGTLLCTCMELQPSVTNHDSNSLLVQASPDVVASWYGFGNRFCSLTALDLSACRRVTNTELGELRRIPQLRSLSLQSCEEVTDLGLAHLQSLHQLTYLDLENCCKVSEPRSWPNEVYVQIPPTRDVVQAVCNTGKSLKIRQQLRCRAQMTDAGLVEVGGHTALMHLNVAGCVALTERGFAAIARRLRRLQTLKLGGCQRMATVSDACIAALTPMTALTSLDVSGCVELRDAGTPSQLNSACGITNQQDCYMGNLDTSYKEPAGTSVSTPGILVSRTYLSAGYVMLQGCNTSGL